MSQLANMNNNQQYLQALDANVLNSMSQTFLLEASEGKPGVYNMFSDPYGHTAAKVSTRGAPCALFNYVDSKVTTENKEYIYTSGSLSDGVLAECPRAFVVGEMENLPVTSFPVGGTSPVYNSPRSENRKIRGGTHWVNARVDRTSLAPIIDVRPILREMLGSAAQWIGDALLRAIFAPVVRTKDGVESIATYADDSEVTIDFSKEALDYAGFISGIDKAILSQNNTGILRNDYYVVLPASIWTLIYKSNLSAATRGQMQLPGINWVTETGVNILVVPDDKIPVENGLFQVPLINKRALAARINNPGHAIPGGFVNLLGLSALSVSSFNLLIQAIGGMGNLPCMLYGTHSSERHCNDAVFALLFDFVAGRISSKGVSTLKFSASGQKVKHPGAPGLMPGVDMAQLVEIASQAAAKAVATNKEKKVN